MNSKAAAASMESSNWHVDSGTYAHLVQKFKRGRGKYRQRKEKRNEKEEQEDERRLGTSRRNMREIGEKWRNDEEENSTEDGGQG